MSGEIFRPLEKEEAIFFGRIRVDVFYHNKRPVKIRIIEKRPEWTEEDMKRRAE